MPLLLNRRFVVTLVCKFKRNKSNKIILSRKNPKLYSQLVTNAQYIRIDSSLTYSLFKNHSRYSMLPKATSEAITTDLSRIKVLFICLGNVCRSPTAEAMFTSLVKEMEIADKFVIDSCGLGGGYMGWYKKGGECYHLGDDSDPRMTEAAKKRNVYLTSKSRPLKPEDLDYFDYILVMDDENINGLIEAAEYWKTEDDNKLKFKDDYMNKVSKLTDYCNIYTESKEVPDPYFGGMQGFETVLDLVEDACEGFLSHLVNKKILEI